jgi:hypothetical protein
VTLARSLLNIIVRKSQRSHSSESQGSHDAAAVLLLA